MTDSQKWAFRCLHCGNLEPASSAGEREVPGSCHICGRGVSFDPISGIKEYHPENWQVLNDLLVDELKGVLEFFKIPRSDIEAPHKTASSKGE